MRRSVFLGLALLLAAVALLPQQPEQTFAQSTPTANADGSYTVPQDWALIPSGLEPGTTFRLLFVTSTTTNAESTDIADYNTQVQARAAAGHTAIQPYSSQFKVVGCTATVDAHENTGTAQNGGEPIYWLNSVKLADDYANFYDGQWDDTDKANAREESGSGAPGANDWVWTGCNDNGTSHASAPLGGTPNVAQGRYFGSQAPINGRANQPRGNSHRLYALSPVFVVDEAPPTANPDGSYTVPQDWALIPSGVEPGDRFRLMVLTSTKRDASSADIADYNTHVQNAVAGGHDKIRRYSAQFRVVGSTSTVDARDNAGLTGTGVPIHWLNGVKAFNDYAGFFDAHQWTDTSVGRNEHGRSQAQGQGFYTGSNFNATKHDTHPLGAAHVRIGGLAHGLWAGIQPANDYMQSPYIALSPIFVVQETPRETVDVPAAWPLIPSGLGPGDSFRLVFMSSTERDARSHLIYEYDVHVQNAAAAGHAQIRRYASDFRALGCTQAVDARDHTSSTGAGEPIYWLNGPKVADDYAGFYDGTWDTAPEDPWDESGAINFGYAGVWSGCNNDGTKDATNYLGANPVREADPTSTGRALRAPYTTTSTTVNSLLGLSPVFVIMDPRADVKLVSNFDQPDGTNISLNNDLAQAFTTGGVAGGYTLTGVAVRIGLLNDSAIFTSKVTATIRENSSNGRPGTVVGTLMNPTYAQTSTDTTFTFTASSGIDLEANTKYWFMLDVTQAPTGANGLRETTSNAEDRSGLSDWKIEDSSDHRTWNQSTWTRSTTNKRKILINGRPNHHLDISAPQGEQRAGATFDIGVVGGVPAPTGNPVRVKVSYSRTVLDLVEPSGQRGDWFNMNFTPGNWNTAQTLRFKPADAVQRTFTTYVTFESYELIQVFEGRKCALLQGETTQAAEARGGCWDAYGTQKGHVHTQRVPIVVGAKNPRIVSSDVSLTYQGGVNCFDARREWTKIDCIWLYEGEPAKFNYASHSDGYAEGNRASALLGKTGRTTVENQAFTYTISIPTKPGPDQTFTVKPVVDGSGVTLSHDGTEDAQGAIILSPDDHSVTVKVVPNDDDDVTDNDFTIKHTLGGSFGYDSLFHQGGYLWITGEVQDDDRVAKAPIFKDADGNEINASNPLRLPTRAAANNTAEYYFTVELPHPLASMVTVRTSATFTPYRASDGRVLYRSLRAHEPIHLATGAFDPKYPDHYVWVHFGRDYELDAVARINVRKSSTITATDGETDVLHWSIKNAYGSHTKGTLPIVYDSSLLPSPFIAAASEPDPYEQAEPLASDDPLVKYAGLIANVYGYISDHFDDEADIEWKRVLKAFQHEEYQDYPYDAATAADARQRYTDTQDPRWAPIGDALAYTESYTPPAALKQAVTPEPPLEKYADLITRIKTDMRNENYRGEEHDLKRVLKTLGVPEYANYDGGPVGVEEATNRRTLPRRNTHWDGIAEAIQYKLDYDAGTLTPPPATPVITISGGSGVTEGGTATFTISASPAPASPITVNIGVSETGSFGASGAATVTVSGASTTYTIATSDDNVDEADGSVTATVQAGSGYTVGSASTASVSVADNDAPPVVEQEAPLVKYAALVQSFYDRITANHQHGDGASGGWNKRFLKAMGHPEYVNYPQAAATVADAQRIYDHISPGGSTAWDGTVEAIQYKLDYDAGTVTPPPATPEITISGGSGITEGGTATFTISANPAPASPITVNVGVSESGNWGASGASTVTVSGASTTYTITTSDDNVDEPNGSVTATVQSGSGYTVGTPSAASVSVADNDTPPPATPVITISAGSGITEGGSATFTISANPAPASPITVNIGVSESGSFGASGPATVTVSGATTTYTITTSDDNVDEPNGSVTATVQAGGGYAVGAPSAASVNVSDNDDPAPVVPVITISAGSSITEGGSATFTITASPAPASPITVNVGVTESGSFGASGASTVSVSGASTTYTVTTSDDDVDESNGSITVRVQSGAGYNVGSPASAAVSVADNDDPPEVRDERTQLTAQVTALRDKYAKLQHDSLTHWNFYQRVEEVLKALNGERSRLDTGWLAPSYMRNAINTATGFGDTQAAELLAEARDFLGITVLN